MTGTAPTIESFVKFTEEDVVPDTPRINLEIEAGDTLSLTQPYYTLFTLRSDNGQDKPCILSWSATFEVYGHGQLVLLRHVQDGYELVPVKPRERVKLTEEDEVTVQNHAQSIWELAPGGHITMRNDPREEYYRAMRPNETYTLLYTGGETTMWRWGQKKDHLGEKLVRTTDGSGQKMIIPGGARATFTTREEDTPWPDRTKWEKQSGFESANNKEQMWRLEEARKAQPSPPPVSLSNISSGLPLLDAYIECETRFSTEDDFWVTLKVKYTGIKDQEFDEHSKPIVFHTYALWGHDDRHHGERLYRSRDDGKTWEKCKPDDDSGGFMIVDDPDLEVSPLSHKDFACLKPGEEWEHKRRLHNKLWSNLPSDLKAGDRFRYLFKGAEIEWWDWGSEEDHHATKVMLPCYEAGWVTQPKDNGGRPRLVLKASEPVEFTAGIL